jgi:hypothetical protein
MQILGERMAEYKDAIKRSHPYEGQAPEECTVEKIPCMTGHDDQIERMSGQGAPPALYSTPYFIDQSPPSSRHEEHNHPGDDVIENG